MFKRPTKKEVRKDKTTQPKPQSGFQLAFSALLDVLGQPNATPRRQRDF